MMFRAYPREIINLSAKEIIHAFSSLFAPRIDGGEEVGAFERQFARKMDCREAIAVSSARFALALILQAKGLKPGDEVILPSLTYHAVPNILIAMKFRPVFVDSRETDFNINPDLIEQEITARTRAIIPTHLFGQPAEMKAIRKIAGEHDLLVIEDCAQAVGAEYHRKTVGSIGNAGIFSLSLGKNLCGISGGMITTQDVELVDSIRAKVTAFTPYSRLSIFKSILSSAHLWFSSHPVTFKYTTYPLMYTSRLFGIDVADFILSHTRRRQNPMDGVPESMRKRFLILNAKILMGQLQSLDEKNEKRIALAKKYNEAFEALDGVSIAQLSLQNKNIYTVYGVRVPYHNHRQLQRSLISKGIDSQKSYVSVCSDLAIFRKFSTDCPVARQLYDELIHLPINHCMAEDDVHHIADVFRKSIQ